MVVEKSDSPTPSSGSLEEGVCVCVCVYVCVCVRMCARMREREREYAEKPVPTFSSCKSAENAATCNR